MKAQWFKPAVAMLMSESTVARQYRQGKKRPIVIVAHVGTVVQADFTLPSNEFRLPALGDFLTRRATPYLRANPGLVAEFTETLERFERLATITTR